MEVTRVVTPDAAIRAKAGGSKLAPSAVIHGAGPVATRAPVPRGATVEKDAVVLGAGGGEVVHKLGPGDVIQVDARGRIVGVKTGGRRIAFVPGSAASPPGSDEVRGALAVEGGAPRTIPLGPDDAIEMTGEVEDGDAVPGGRVESTRSTAALVSGVVLLSIAFVPTAIVGAKSPRSFDRALLVPIAGPWIDLAGRAKCVPPAGSEKLPVDPCIEESASRIGVIVSGIAQALGAVVTLIGVPSRLEIREGDAKTGLRVDVEPLSVRGGAGVGVRGVF